MAPRPNPAINAVFGAMTIGNDQESNPASVISPKQSKFSTHVPLQTAVAFQRELLNKLDWQETGIATDTTSCTIERENMDRESWMLRPEYIRENTELSITALKAKRSDELVH